MNILIAMDDNYVLNYLVTLKSLFSNTNENICLYIIRDETLSDHKLEYMKF